MTGKIIFFRMMAKQYASERARVEFLGELSKLPRFDTAAQTARTDVRSGKPGANNTSAPALSNACAVSSSPATSTASVSGDRAATASRRIDRPQLH